MPDKASDRASDNTSGEEADEDGEDGEDDEDDQDGEDGEDGDGVKPGLLFTREAPTLGKTRIRGGVAPNPLVGVPPTI